MRRTLSTPDSHQLKVSVRVRTDRLSSTLSRRQESDLPHVSFCLPHQRSCLHLIFPPPGLLLLLITLLYCRLTLLIILLTSFLSLILILLLLIRDLIHKQSELPGLFSRLCFLSLVRGAASLRDTRYLCFSSSQFSVAAAAAPRQTFRFRAQARVYLPACR